MSKITIDPNARDGYRRALPSMIGVIRQRMTAAKSRSEKVDATDAGRLQALGAYTELSELLLDMQDAYHND